MNVGRCIPEILRTIQALQVAECSKASTPANWVPCEPVIMKMPQTFTGLLEREEEIRRNQNGMSWYLSFEEPKGCCELGEESKIEGENETNMNCRKEIKENIEESRENR